jgi:hypothetical protein
MNLQIRHRNAWLPKYTVRPPTGYHQGFIGPSRTDLIEIPLHTPDSREEVQGIAQARNPETTCERPGTRGQIMAHFNQRPGTKSAFHTLKKPLADLTVFDTIIRSLVMDNPLGCTSYRTRRKHYPPIEKVREMYTAKFVYEDPEGKRTGTGQEIYNSVEGYQYGIAAVLSNMANVAAHRGKVRHLPGSDHFSVILKCHDPDGEMYFLSLARDRVTVSSYMNDEIRRRVERWTDSVTALA